ncbi:hypothetical protein JCM19294_1579 [Nonlabens tegetincola]|uniref:DUF4437 domain-containing protein n=1 Tax=Nonlabens tegetincola TaxID=323273 RepID=A0A090Q6Z6_9FLAO|nr:DUF4437 domain-containing protein [Nonlabens tegetincola]GAK97957.1 hypothetical protein JCM19294_1579 [Nonlabens tegetincola]
MIKRTMIFTACALILMGCNTPNKEEKVTSTTNNQNTEVVLSSQVNWSPLNAARGDASPQAGDLWGNRKENQASGFLVKFKEGFSSPPHIHNITYRGIVIKGSLHNDDPNAKSMWMPQGSFWTQPAGEGHITAANASENTAYVEIDSGPYLVKPEDQAFENEEKPINIHKSNLVWIEASDLQWTNLNTNDKSRNKPEIAFLWGQPNNNDSSGALIKLPSGFSGTFEASGKEFRAIVIGGNLTYKASKSKELDPGSYFGSTDNASHIIINKSSEPVILYIKSTGAYQLLSE